MDALSEHVRTGRLDIVEFDERSEKVSTARIRRDLEPLFADLPEPHPSVLHAARRAVPAARGTVEPEGWQQRLAASAVPIAAVLAVLLFFTVARGMVFVFVLPAIIALLAGSFSPHRRRR